jgi:sulfatase modifying factor 1
MAEPARLDSRTGLEFLPVPGGEFRMGSEEEDEDARPVHRVRVGAFELSRCEVTHAQFGRFMAETGHPAPAHWSTVRLNAAEQPVVGVTWEDAAAYARWAGGRLPTEAECEFAARGTDGRRYPWGNEEPDRDRAAFHLDIGFGATVPVGGAKAGAGPFGHLDLAGNVCEWCADWYDPAYYARSPAENPTGPEQGERRVIRGGSWVSLPDACRATARASYPPRSRSVLVGFRVARRGGIGG